MRPADIGISRRERAAVFLDRDGVLNRATVTDGVPHPPASERQVEILPGVEEALRSLAEGDFARIVVTNQPDVARGTQTRDGVERINRLLRDRLSIDAIHVCLHDGTDNCSCRKPKPGLLIEAAAAYNIDLSRSFMVGDRWSDVVAGRAAGCRTFLIETPYSGGDRCTPDWRVPDLPAAVRIILRTIPRGDA